MIEDTRDNLSLVQLTYYVVGQVALSNGDIGFAIDYMLGTVVENFSTVYCLLINTGHLGHLQMQLQIVRSGSLNLLFNSKNGNRLTQSAGNLASVGW